MLVICFSVPGLLFSSARGNIAGGNRAYNRGKYDVALEKYMLALNAAPDSSEPAFNIGDVYYKTGSYEDALKSYQKATYSKDMKLQEMAYYNMGNALFRLSKLTEAIQLYKKALELNPGDKDAKFNLEFAQKKIKENMDKKKEQQRQEKKENQNDRDKKSSGDKADKDKKQENKEKRDEKKQENKKEGMSKEDAQRLLDSLSDEKKPKQKADVKIPLFRMPEKDW